MTALQAEADANLPSGDGHRYARLGVRIRAALYDWMILIGGIVIALSLAISLDSNIAAKAIGITGVVLFLMYEPMMIWLWGSTVGHMVCNLRVVDDRTLGNPSLGKAMLRFVIKTLLSWYSFITIMASRRMRAVHDMLTGSTVQIRDIARARAFDFAREWSAPQGSKPVSMLRRIASIVVYGVASFFILGAFLQVLAEQHLISRTCVSANRCSGIEQLIFIVLTLVWFAGLFLIVGLGWRGRLPSFRVR